MKTVFHTLAIGVVLGMAAVAEAGSDAPTQTSAWTPATLHQTLASMPAGDSLRGKTIHEQLLCASCHGEAGVAPSRNYPSLAGQRVAYTYKMLRDYRDRRRNEQTGQARIMLEIVRLMNEQEMADVAAFYAAQPGPASGQADDTTKTVEHLIRKGDPTRLLTPCASCHGAAGEGGKHETPALAGQVREYFIRTMQAYKAGTRNNDVNQGMAQFAASLTQQEIEALAAYYASLPGRPARR
ncbi:MAG: c-type cytochrome [Granulosicoccaceae bacterium]|jgi:cytochrome c553